MSDMSLIIPRLVGINFTRLLNDLKTKKYRIARDCGLNWRTLRNWERGIQKPSKENAEKVAIYLGLLSNEKIARIKLEKQINELNAEFRKLGIRNDKNSVD